MPRGQFIKDSLPELEYEVARQKAVLAAFPDAKLYYQEFHSKSVNQDYTKFDFEKRWSGLYVAPYCEVTFIHNDKTETVKIHSQPRSNRLAYISWRRQADGRRIIKFSRVAINFKNNSFKEDMLNACRVEIMSFIKENPGYAMDQKHLEPRLRKLLAFT